MRACRNAPELMRCLLEDCMKVQNTRTESMSIKIAAFPKCFEYEIGLHRTMTLFDWISMARDSLDVEGLEMYDRFFTSLERDYLLGVADAVHDAGFVIPMLICSPDFVNPDADMRKRAVDYEAQMIEVADLLGGAGTVCRVLSGQQHPGVNKDEGVGWVVDAIRQLIPLAREHNVVLGMENHYKDSQWQFPEFALRADVFLEIVASIEVCPHFGVQYDPSNAIVSGDDPIALLKAIQKRVVSMHASDRYIVGKGELSPATASSNVIGYPSGVQHCVVGKGLNDYDQIFALLSETGFDGWVSIEDGLNGIGEIDESARFLRVMRDKYFSK